MATDFSKRCAILSDLWMNYRDDEALVDFVEYNDMGLPLAYFITTEVVTPTEQAEIYINETFDLLLEALDVADKGFDNLDQMMSTAEK